MKKRIAACGVGVFVGLVSVQMHDTGAMGVREASADDFGFSVLKCFHPTGTYTGSTLGGEYRDADGRATRNGHVDFKGGLSGAAYSMDYLLHTKTDQGDRLQRVTPTTDTAPLPPAAGCYMRQWRRVN